MQTGNGAGRVTGTQQWRGERTVTNDGRDDGGTNAMIRLMKCFGWLAGIVDCYESSTAKQPSGG